VGVQNLAGFTAYYSELTPQDTGTDKKGTRKGPFFFAMFPGTLYNIGCLVFGTCYLNVSNFRRSIASLVAFGKIKT
jgi:hypothetical protein